MAMIQHQFGIGMAVLLLGSMSVSSLADDWPLWRGPERNGISREKRLLQEWPKQGPKLLWHITEAGRGYSTPSVVGDRLYLLGNEGLDNEYVQALSVADGHRIWSMRLGKVGNPDQDPPFPAARSTPTVDGDLLYALSSDGDLACLEINSGAVRWRKNLRTDFGGKPGTWAYAESPLIDGNKVICTPGGGAATMVALNKQTGEPIWKCGLSEADEAAYASVIVVEAGGIRQYVQLLQKGLVGIEAETGRFLWRFPKATSRFNANIPSPLASGNMIYVASAGTGGGLVKLTRQDDGIKAEQVYFESKLPTAIGGAIKLGDYLYGTTGSALLCLEFANGNVKWQERSLGAASLCYADGRLYLHGENGEVGLVEPSPEGYREKGRFAPPSQPGKLNTMEKAWAYPVVANGRLYVRDHGTIWCYDVKRGGN